MNMLTKLINKTKNVFSYEILGEKSFEEDTPIFINLKSYQDKIVAIARNCHDIDNNICATQIYALSPGGGVFCVSTIQCGKYVHENIIDEYINSTKSNNIMTFLDNNKDFTICINFDNLAVDNIETVYYGDINDLYLQDFNKRMHINFNQSGSMHIFCTKEQYLEVIEEINDRVENINIGIQSGCEKDILSKKKTKKMTKKVKKEVKKYVETMKTVK